MHSRQYLPTFCTKLLVSQTELPPDYIELEKRVDALKLVHQKLLQVTYAAVLALSSP